MGAGSSHDPNSENPNIFGTLLIQLENWHNYSGQEVAGLIHILISDPLDP